MRGTVPALILAPPPNCHKNQVNLQEQNLTSRAEFTRESMYALQHSESRNDAKKSLQISQVVPNLYCLHEITQIIKTINIDICVVKVQSGGPLQ